MRPARYATTALLMQLVGNTTLTAEERRMHQLILAALLSCGAMMAATFLVPREIDWVVTLKSTHPPSVVRIVALSASLSQAIKSSFPLVSDEALRHIRRTCLTMVAGATIEPSTQLDIEYQERLAIEGDIAALRATGIRKALYDPTVSTYTRALAAAIVQGTSVLRPRTKA